MPDVGPTTRHRRELLADLLGHPVSAVVPIGAGTDHSAFAVGSDRIARFAGGAPAETAQMVEREAHVLDVVAGRLPLPTPRVIAVHADLGLLVTSRIAGRSLLGRDLPTARTADVVAATLSAIHAISTDALGTMVPIDAHPLTAYADDARAHLDVVQPHLGIETARAVAESLDDVPDDDVFVKNAPATFVHNDFGAEHLFVDGGALSGVIDWADAAIADPARDLSRVLRDFGPGAYHRVIPHYASDWDDRADARTWFLARCAALEDLAFGLTEERPPYIDAALRSMAWLFPTTATPSC